jgi:hypothetical protein
MNTFRPLGHTRFISPSFKPERPISLGCFYSNKCTHDPICPTFSPPPRLLPGRVGGREARSPEIDCGHNPLSDQPQTPCLPAHGQIGCCIRTQNFKTIGNSLGNILFPLGHSTVRLWMNHSLGKNWVNNWKTEMEKTKWDPNFRSSE